MTEQKTFEQWRSVHENSHEGSEPWESSLVKMQEMATNLDEWEWVLCAATYREGKRDLELHALSMMEKTAKTFDDWHRIDHQATACNRHDRELSDRAVDKMKELAVTFEELAILYWRTTHCSEIQRFAMGKMEEMGGTEEQWKKVLDGSNSCSDLYQLAKTRFGGMVA